MASRCQNCGRLITLKNKEETCPACGKNKGKAYRLKERKSNSTFCQLDRKHFKERGEEWEKLTCGLQEDSEKTMGKLTLNPE